MDTLLEPGPPLGYIYPVIKTFYNGAFFASQ
jgi:hypothetical protein